MREDKNIWQDKFSGMKAPLDKDALWNDISNDGRFPEQKKSKRFLFIILFFAFTALMGFLITSQLYTNNTSDTSLIGKNQINEHAKDNSISQNNNISNRDITEESNNDINTSEITLNEYDTPSRGTTFENTPNDYSLLNLEKYRSNLITNYSINTREFNNNTNNTFISKGNKIGLIDDSPNDIEDFKNPFNQDKRTGGNSLELEINSNNSDENNDSESPKLMIDEKENTIENKNEETLLSLDSLNMFPTNFFKIKKDDESIKKLEVTNRKNWAISLGSGLGYSLFSYSHEVNNSPDSTYLKNEAVVLQRKNNTTNILSYRHSLQIERTIEKNWFVGIGLQYTSSNQRFDYRYTEEGDINIYEDSTGTYVTQLLTHTNYELYHNYKALDVSISLGKKVELKNIDLIARGGIAFNTYFKTEGEYVDNYRDTYDRLANINEGNIYKKRLGLSYFAELGVSKRMTSNISLYGTFSYHTPIRLTQKTSYLKQKSNSIFLNVGLRFDF